MSQAGAGPSAATPPSSDKRGKGTERNSSAVTRGYEKKLMIAVPPKYGFTAFLNFAIDIFRTAMGKLQHPPDYELCAFNGTYDQLVHNVSKGIFDGAVGDVTITAERAKVVDFTMPYAPSGVSLLVLADNDSKPPIQWIFLKPLTKELWLTTVSFFFIVGFVVWMIERPRNPAYQGPSVTQFSTASYFAFSTLTFSHGQIIRSPLYTANLSSMLTAKRLRPRVTNLDQLVHNGEYIGYQRGAFVYSVLRKAGARAHRLRAYDSQTEYSEALRNGSENGGVSAIVDEIPYLSYFLSDPQENKKFEMVDRLYKTPGFGFVFPRGSPLVHNLSVAILGLTAGNESSLLEQKWFGSAAPSTGDTSPIADSTPLTLRSFSGLFVITGCVSASMLLISIIRLVYAKHTRVRCSESRRGDGNGASLHSGETSAVHIEIGNGSMPDHRHHEVRENDAEDAHGGGGSAGDEETGTMQNGMYSGSAPADCVQIDMSASGQGTGRDL
ncbi:hypothetical protein ACP70R_041689 [Stipagrostis hirtigluma subsp. patula]